MKILGCTFMFGSMAAVTLLASGCNYRDTVANLRSNGHGSEHSSSTLGLASATSGSCLPAFATESAASDSLSLPDGAIKLFFSTEPQGAINPYFASYNLLYRLDVDPSKTVLQITRNYLLWYLDHINVIAENGQFELANGFVVTAPGLDANAHRPGTIYNFYFSATDPEMPAFMYFKKYPQGSYAFNDFKELEANPAIFSPLVYDSNDSYAALFLKVLAKYTRLSNDYTIVTDASQFYRIQLILQAMISTRKTPYNLTGATPFYPTGYFMDNSEVWSGLSDYVGMMQTLAQPKIGSFDVAYNISTYAQLRDDFVAAIESRLRIKSGANGGLYRVGFDLEGGVPSGALDWGNRYPDANSNLIGILDGYIWKSQALDRATKIFYQNFPAYIDGKGLPGDRLPDLWQAVAFMKVAPKVWRPKIKTLLKAVCENQISKNNRSWQGWDAAEEGAYLWLLKQMP